MKEILFVMPFGKKDIITKGKKDKEKKIKVDFDDVYNDLREVLKEENNFKIYRVDKIIKADILNKMYKAIHSAEVVIADLTGLIPNVMYELGARHALRDKVTIMIRRDENVKIPFDVNSFVVCTYKEFKKNWRDLINATTIDSPIKKEISKINDDRLIFESYENTWEKFMNKMNDESIDEKDYDKRMKILNEFKDFEGIEEYDQILALNLYKRKNENLEDLKKSLKIIENHNPLISIESETVGLACSITRKLFEIDGRKEYMNKSFNYSRHFISVDNTPYAYSSYVLNSVALAEKNELSIQYIKEDSQMILKIFESNAIDDEWYSDTQNLLKFLSGENMSVKDFENETSIKSFERAKTLYSKNIK